MRFDVYCDESRPDLLCSNKPQAEYLVLGSLWLESINRDAFKKEIHALRDKHKVGGEFKWQKVSPSRVDFYCELVEWFDRQGDNLRFRCIAVDHRRVELKLFHDGDQELGFYKFYYQMLHHWVLDCNEYEVFVDYKRNRQQDRLEVLRRCLANANLLSQVHKVQAVRSEEAVLIQLVDVLTGMAAHRLNQQLKNGSAKTKVLSHCESLIGHLIRPTPKGEEKFNVFMIELNGGW